MCHISVKIKPILGPLLFLHVALVENEEHAKISLAMILTAKKYLLIDSPAISQVQPQCYRLSSRSLDCVVFYRTVEIPSPR